MIHKLEADSIHLKFGPRTILSDIYLQLETGRISGLLGRNGNGKSCLLNIIYGTLTANNKFIRIDDCIISQAFKRPDLLLYLPQFNFIPASLSLKRIFDDFGLEYSSFEKLFPEFASKYNYKIKDLSGGQKRLIEIYTVVKSPSQFAMLDEPFSHLSPIMIDVIKEIIMDQKKNKGILITDHMYRHILDISDDLYFLTEGNIRLTKSVDELEFLGYVKF